MYVYENRSASSSTPPTHTHTHTRILQVDKGVAMYIRFPLAEKSFAFRWRYTIRSFSNGK